MLFIDTETAKMNRIIAYGAGTGMTELQFFAKEIGLWKSSQARREQIKGDEYYRGFHDILGRKRTAIGQDGELKEVTNLPNAKIIHNLYAKMVDQKTNYLTGRPLTISSQSDRAQAAISKWFDKRTQRTIKYLTEDALTGGVAWLFVYYDQNGELSFRRFPAYQVLPFWADDDHTRLDAAVRLYPQEVWDGSAKKIVERVEIFKPDGIYRYVYDGTQLIPDVELGERDYYITVDGEGYSWEHFPLIAFKRNKNEIPLIRNVKSLQDGINQLLSDFQNNMQEDARNTILVIRNYDGQDLGEFRQNLATYGVVKVRDEGGVETLTVEVNSSNYQAILDTFKKALIENAMGYDAKDDRLGANANQLNIQSMYSDIDLDASGMETEFQAALEELLWFIKQDIRTKGGGNFVSEEVSVIFNKDILINESEAIENCAKSVGLISTETIVEQHPWINDPQAELERLAKEKEETMKDYNGAFPGFGGGDE